MSTLSVATLQSKPISEIIPLIRMQGLLTHEQNTLRERLSTMRKTNERLDQWQTNNLATQVRTFYAPYLENPGTHKRSTVPRDELFFDLGIDTYSEAPKFDWKGYFITIVTATGIGATIGAHQEVGTGALVTGSIMASSNYNSRLRERAHSFGFEYRASSAFARELDELITKYRLLY